MSNNLDSIKNESSKDKSSLRYTSQIKEEPQVDSWMEDRLIIKDLLKQLQLKDEQLKKLKFNEKSPPPLTQSLNKNVLKMVDNLAEKIPFIETKFKTIDVFIHLEKFDRYITTATNYDCYHDELCLMASYDKLADVHQVQCQLHFDVTSDWSMIQVPAYRSWLVSYFRIYENADKCRKTLMSETTVQTRSAEEFHAYLSSLKRQVPASNQLNHDFQLCFVNGIHPDIALPIHQNYNKLTRTQQPDARFLPQEEWAAFLTEVFDLDNKFGHGLQQKKLAKRKFTSSKLSSVIVPPTSAMYPTRIHLQHLEALDGYDPVVNI
ncbi:hypothetical protein HK099_002022 [Clydaea vesicula]|uniref:Uncharacterized protein n=1 Tax=Clydaea vesicula TaxID=447962 RepID=A0AAD5XRT1_9FUNG|nr:hypothetical protein HK099_002022 [Clydaea vesicula]